MTKSLAAVAFLVPDYDDAIAWFRGALGFDLIEDAPLGEDKRWVVVAPPGGATTTQRLSEPIGASSIRSKPSAARNQAIASS